MIRRVALWIAILSVLGLAAFLVVTWVGRGAREASTTEQLRRFRDAQAKQDRTTTPQARAAGFSPPDAGVYTYNATGTERLSLLNTSQLWGPTIPATVSLRADGCWTLRLNYSTHHTEDQRYCSAGRNLLDEGGTTFQSFDFGAITVTDTTVFTCDPPGDAARILATPGQSWGQSCTGVSTEHGTHVTSAGTNTFIGKENLDIGGTTVPALHYRRQRTLTGDQRGTEDTHYWFSAETGLVLRSSHDTTVASPSPIGDVTYTEVGRFDLDSLTPRT